MTYTGFFTYYQDQDKLGLLLFLRWWSPTPPRMKEQLGSSGSREWGSAQSAAGSILAADRAWCRIGYPVLLSVSTLSFSFNVAWRESRFKDTDSMWRYADVAMLTDLNLKQLWVLGTDIERRQAMSLYIRIYDSTDSQITAHKAHHTQLYVGVKYLDQILKVNICEHILHISFHFQVRNSRCRRIWHYTLRP